MTRCHARCSPAAESMLPASARRVRAVTLTMLTQTTCDVQDVNRRYLPRSPPHSAYKAQTIASYQCRGASGRGTRRSVRVAAKSGARRSETRAIEGAACARSQRKKRLYSRLKLQHRMGAARGGQAGSVRPQEARGNRARRRSIAAIHELQAEQNSNQTDHAHGRVVKSLTVGAHSEARSRMRTGHARPVGGGALVGATCARTESPTCGRSPLPQQIQVHQTRTQRCTPTHSGPEGATK
jgi:hypothetical protein